MTLPQISVCSLTKRVVSCGPRAAISPPRLATRSRTSGACSAFAIASASFATIGAGVPAGAKIAFINPQRIFQESADGKAALTRVNALTQKKQTENTAKQKALQDNQQKLQSGGSVMSDQARDQLQKEIERQQLDLQRFQQDAQAEIQELQTEVQNEFARKVQPLIDQIAKEKGLQLVFNVNDAGFAWVEPGLDLTGELIKKLDAKPATSPKP